MMNIVITGTSQGIGLELTRQILCEGHQVMAIARKSAHWENLLSLQSQAPDRLKVVEADLTKEESLQVINRELKDWEKVDVLINNAGIYLKDDRWEDFQHSFQLNTVIPYMLTKQLLPKLKSATEPKVLNISSQMGSIAENSSGGSHTYRASKAALNMIGKGLAVEESWLTLITLHPGWVQTNMGGEQAPISAKESVSKIWPLVKNLTLKDSGKFLNYQGENLSW